MGELGNGTTINSAMPIQVVGLSDAIGITTGLYHSCAWTAHGETYCWGSNFYGHLGDGTKTDRLTPVLVNGLNDTLSLWQLEMALHAQ